MRGYSEIPEIVLKNTERYEISSNNQKSSIRFNCFENNLEHNFYGPTNKFKKNFKNISG